MNRVIKTYSDLCEEKERMTSLLAVQRQRVIEDWNEVKHEFQPVKNVFGVFGKMTKGTKTNPLVNSGIKIATEVFLKNFVLAKAGWVTRLAVPFVMKNYSSHLLANKGNTFFDKLARMLKGRKSTTSNRVVAASHNINPISSP